MALCSVQSQSILEESQGRNSNRNPEARSEAEATEKQCLLACSPWLVRPALLYNTGPHQGWQCLQQTTSVDHVNHQSRKCPQRLLIHRQFDGGISFFGVPSSQITQAFFFKVRQKNPTSTNPQKDTKPRVKLSHQRTKMRPMVPEQIEWTNMR